MTISNLDVLLFLFGISLLFHVQFQLLFADLHTDFSRDKSGGLVSPSLSEFFIVYCDSHSQGFGIVNKAEIDVFLELSCFFHDPADVCNLISGSSAFSMQSTLCKMPAWNKHKLESRLPGDISTTFDMQIIPL